MLVPLLLGWEAVWCWVRLTYSAVMRRELNSLLLSLSGWQSGARRPDSSKQAIPSNGTIKYISRMV